MEGKKQQVSLSIDKVNMKLLDKWIKWQLEYRSVTIDRSHIVNVLLRRFLEANASHLVEDNSSETTDETN